MCVLGDIQRDFLLWKGIRQVKAGKDEKREAMDKEKKEK
jgi:hypothetical protein